ncbi:hypothetical protein LINPERPRIM_LOCUS28637 [Linum perenne]
MVILMLLKVL